MRTSLLAALLALAACPGDETEDTEETDETVIEPVVRLLQGHLGAATSDGLGYAGTEEWYLVAVDEDLQVPPTDLCRIRRTVTSIASRDDCGMCSWAFDVVLTDPQVVADDDCSKLEVDLSDLSPLDGETRSQGYAHDYIGHANVLMVFADERWDAVTFATWTEETSSFEYDWESGYVED